MARLECLVGKILLMTFHQLTPGILSSLPTDQRESSYDSMAAGYDLLVGNAIYNRLVWGCPKSAYVEAATDFLGQSEGLEPIIDYGCGSLIFTASAYQGHEGRLLLFDRSLGMIERGAKRLPSGRFLQGDALAPPFDDKSFAGGMSWGMTHLFGSRSCYLPAFAALLEPAAPAALCCLVLSGRRIGDGMLRLLHRRGEAAEPETAGDIETAFGGYFDIQATVLRGNMLFLRGKRK